MMRYKVINGLAGGAPVEGADKWPGAGLTRARGVL